MNISKAKELLRDAENETDRVSRHLLVAAAIREALTEEPIVVGGLAQDFHTAPIYHYTDLDLCAPIKKRDRQTLDSLGFTHEGRHWYHAASRVAVEFPDVRIDGDEARTILQPVGSGAARIIGVDDLYLDRIRQATASGSENDVSFHGALAVASARYVDIDWKYVRDRLRSIDKDEPTVAGAMRRLDRRVRSRVRRSLSGS